MSSSWLFPKLDFVVSRNFRNVQDLFWTPWLLFATGQWISMRLIRDNCLHNTMYLFPCPRRWRFSRDSRMYASKTMVSKFIVGNSSLSSNTCRRSACRTWSDSIGHQILTKQFFSSRETKLEEGGQTAFENLYHPTHLTLRFSPTRCDNGNWHRQQQPTEKHWN